MKRRLSVTNLSSENNLADVSTECSSRHQGESLLDSKVKPQICTRKTGEDPAWEGGYVHSDWRSKAFPGLCVLRWSLALFLGAQKNGRELPLVFRVPGNESIWYLNAKSCGLLATFSGLCLNFDCVVFGYTCSVCV